MLRIRNRKAGWHRAAVLALVLAAIVGMIGSSAAFAADVDGMQELGANPTAVSFGNVAVGATSASQSDTVTNTFGDDAITFSSILVTRGYMETGTTCGSSLGPLQSCEVDVACEPTSNGYLFGVLAFFYTSSDISAEIDPWDSLPKATFVKLTCTGVTGVATATPTATATATQTATSTATSTATATATPTDTATATATPTFTATATATDTATATTTATQTATATATPTDTATATATDTATATATATDTSTPTATATQTPTASPTATHAPLNVFGTAIQNGMNGAAITAVSVNPDGTDASSLGSTSAASNGSFSMSIPAQNGPVRFRASGGHYLSEQNGANISSPSPLSVLLPSLQTNLSSLSINPLTTFVDSLAVGNISRGQNLATALSNSTASIESDYGISNDPSGLTPLYTAAAIGTDSGRLGLILGAIVNEDQLACASTPGGLVTALSSDISDGVFDGTISGTPVSYCGGSLAAIAGTAEFGDALSGLQGLTLATRGFVYGGTNNSLTLNSATAAQVAAEDATIEGAVVAATPPSVDTFAGTTPSMNNARYTATATLLSNGKVLIAGGQNNFAPISSTELYDPVTNTFAASTPSMNSARSVATATLLPNGKVLIAGGNGTGSVALKSVELYDPVSNTFAAAPSMNTARSLATATLLPNGKVLIAGGSFLSSTELYDPATNTFAAAGTTPVMNTGRSWATATLLPNGKVLIAGGAVNMSMTGARATTELYDPVANTFAASTPVMKAARYTATATLLANGKVLIAGGTQDGNFGLSSTELYDPVSNSFAASTPVMNGAHAAASAALLPNGEVLIAGGLGASGPVSSTEVYDPVANTFAATTPAMKNSRYSATGTLLPNGKVLIAGGFNISAFLSGTDLYTP